MTERLHEINYWQHARCGDSVFDHADPRHVGRLEAVHNSATATVTWIATGWKSHVPVRDLRRAPATSFNA